MLAGDELRGFLGRVLGWASGYSVDHALRSIELAAAGLAHLVVCGAGDLVPIACALHRRMHGADRPFIVCDPRRGKIAASVRSPANLKSGVAAFEAAAGGTVCVRSWRLPRDFSSLVARLRRTEDVSLVVCANEDDETSPLLVRPAPICLPPLARRTDELPRIIHEYAMEAIAELRVLSPGFSDADRTWVLDHAATSLSEIEKSTRRLVAIRASRNMSDAAARLGMAPVSLSRWVGRREPLPRDTAAQARAVITR